jgi:hypothetical protein
MMDNKRKLASDTLIKLTHGRSYVSKSGAAQSVNTIQARGIPTAASRRTIGRAIADVTSTDGVYGTLVKDFVLPLKKGGDTTVAVACPIAMTHAACKKSGFAILFKEALRRYPPSFERPWSIILYNDGIAMNPFSSGAKGCVFIRYICERRVCDCQHVLS